MKTKSAQGGAVFEKDKKEQHWSRKMLVQLQSLETIDENYIVELKYGPREYDGQLVCNLLPHVKKYGRMDNTVHKQIEQVLQSTG